MDITLNPRSTHYPPKWSPQMYYSAYSPEYIGALAETLTDAAGSAPAWCMFDNTELDDSSAARSGAAKRAGVMPAV